MRTGKLSISKRLLAVAGFSLLVSFSTRANDKDFPDKPVPPRLVNDLAHCMTDAQDQQLEAKLEDFNRTSSVEITIVTIKSLGDYDASDYAIQLGNKWGVGKAGKNNGVLVLAAINDRKAFIATGKGTEDVLTDAKTGVIYRNEMVPSFKEGNYYEGFSKAADAIIAVTKGEYKADEGDTQVKKIPTVAIIVLVLVILWIISRFRGPGGTYMSNRGWGGFGAGWFLGSGLGGGSWGGGSNSGGGGGFGGFGGGGFGGGGAGGSW
jgi:uncharacterized protein